MDRGELGLEGEEGFYAKLPGVLCKIDEGIVFSLHVFINITPFSLVLLFRSIDSIFSHDKLVLSVMTYQPNKCDNVGIVHIGWVGLQVDY